MILPNDKKVIVLLPVSGCLMSFEVTFGSPEDTKKPLSCPGRSGVSLPWKMWQYFQIPDDRIVKVRCDGQAVLIVSLRIEQARQETSNIIPVTNRTIILHE